MAVSNDLVVNAIKNVYHAFFNREPDEAGLAYWVKAAETSPSLGQLVLDIIYGTEKGSDDYNELLVALEVFAH